MPHENNTERGGQSDAAKNNEKGSGDQNRSAQEIKEGIKMSEPLGKYGIGAEALQGAEAELRKWITRHAEQISDMQSQIDDLHSLINRFLDSQKNP